MGGLCSNHVDPATAHKIAFNDKVPNTGPPTHTGCIYYVAVAVAVAVALAVAVAVAVAITVAQIRTRRPLAGVQPVCVNVTFGRRPIRVWQWLVGRVAGLLDRGVAARRAMYGSTGLSAYADCTVFS